MAMLRSMHNYMLESQRCHVQAFNASSYHLYNTTEQLNSAYMKLLQQAKQKMLDPTISLSAIIYTELSDVENEVNLCQFS